MAVSNRVPLRADRGIKVKGKEAYSSSCYKHLTATGTHVPYGITQCYLEPGRGDIPAFTPANLGRYSI